METFKCFDFIFSCSVLDVSLGLSASHLVREDFNSYKVSCIYIKSFIYDFKSAFTN